MEESAFAITPSSFRAEKHRKTHQHWKLPFSHPTTTKESRMRSKPWSMVKIPMAPKPRYACMAPVRCFIKLSIVCPFKMRKLNRGSEMLAHDVGWSGGAMISSFPSALLPSVSCGLPKTTTSEELGIPISETRKQFSSSRARRIEFVLILVALWYFAFSLAACNIRLLKSM